MVLSKILGVVALVCMIWVIYEVVAVNRRLSNLAKVIWIVCAIFFSIITAIVYYFVEKR